MFYLHSSGLMASTFDGTGVLLSSGLDGYGLLETLSQIGDWGVSPTGQSFRVVPCVWACVLACVRSYARSGCLVEVDRKRGADLFPFPFWNAELSLSLLGRRAFPFPFSIKCIDCIKCIICTKCIKCMKCCSPPPPPKPPIQLQ